MAVRLWGRLARALRRVGEVSKSIVYGGSGLSNVDGKGRMTIPAEIRKSVEISSAGNTVCISRHPDPEIKCLIGFGGAERSQIRSDIEKEWESALGRGESFNRETAGTRASSTFETVFEPSGRFVLQPMLRHFGKIENQIFIFGATTHFMLWNPEIFMNDAPPQFDHVREELDYWLNIHGKGGK